MSIPRDEISCFVSGVADLVKDEYYMPMLHNDMTLSCIMVYYQSIDDSKLGKMDRNMNMSGSSDQSQPRFKQKVSCQEELRIAKVKLEKGGGSQVYKPKFTSCGKRNYGEYLLGIGRYLGYGKYAQKVSDCPTSEGKKVPPSFLGNDALKKNHFFALWTRGSRSYEGNDYDGKFVYFSV